MPRVNRTFVLSLLIVSGSLFLLFQLYYYRKYVSKPGPQILSRTGHLTASDVQWQTVKTFLALAQHFRLPVFLVDTAALMLLSQDALRQRDWQGGGLHCRFLCTSRPVTSFALHANLWKYEPGFLLAAEEKGFELLELKGEDPRLASLDTLSGEEIPLHFLFRLHGYIIQVVFLYERSGNYLWHGALRLKSNMDRSFAPFKLLDYGHHAGAYDRPDLVLTVLDGLDVRVPRNISRFLSEQRHARFLECRYHDARNFLQLYPDDMSPAAVDFRRNAKSLLHLAAQTLAHLNIPFWLSSGTCLGWFRQCSVISYSHDVDVGIFIIDFRWRTAWSCLFSVRTSNWTFSFFMKMETLFGMEEHRQRVAGSLSTSSLASRSAGQSFLS
uniref:ribitol-5-phosphate transferase FKTN isoform X2 n=1 Tax=Monopterus albus TaxID=43700 RepID=UPI0009B4824F|nr:fukutin isoform X2 [Monopterus albus]